MAELVTPQASKTLDRLSPGWRQTIGQEFGQDYMESLRQFLRDEYRSGAQVFPDKANIFRALELVPYEKVNVVILGQDPYHGQQQANGLAFAVHDGIPMPPSLKNIFKELSNDLNVPIPRSSSLLHWAQQGVLLLNTVLTVRAHAAFSHRGRGWERFTDAIIQALNDRSEPVVFMLWGAPAIAKASLIQNRQHCILRAPHPSPLSAHRGFFGCKHFSKANTVLQQWGRAPIQWDHC